MRNLRLNSCRVVRYGTHLNGDMCTTGRDRSHHNRTARQCVTGSAGAVPVQIDGFLRITKRGCYPNQPNSPSLLTTTTCRSGSAMPLSITSSWIDSDPGDGVPWKKPTNLSGFFGGTLRGAIQKLDYIQSLGCNAVWLSPLFASPSHHGYDGTDYYTVEPRFGTNAELIELIEKAHQRGMRIILDFVANHWSNQHPTFQAAQHDPDSEYRAWYTWQHWPDEYTSFFGVKGMPQLNLKHKPTSDYLLRCVQHWLRKGVDGYRLDYAPGPPRTFWADFRQACKAVNPDAFLFGEVVSHSEVIASYIPHFDGCLDFLLADALRRTFVLETSTPLEFEAFLAAHEMYFPKDFSLPAFLDNHDMTRILYLAGEDKAKVRLAALVLFTLSAPPVIYNGTEVGVSQRNPLGRFEEARLPMPWGDEARRKLVGLFPTFGSVTEAVFGACFW